MNFSKMSLDELRDLRNQIAREMNYRNEVKRNQIKSSIQVGDHVKIDHPQLQGKRLIVEKIKIKKADIKEIGEDGTIFHPGWVVPITLLQKF